MKLESLNKLKNMVTTFLSNFFFCYVTFSKVVWYRSAKKIPYMYLEKTYNKSHTWKASIMMGGDSNSNAISTEVYAQVVIVILKK